MRPASGSFVARVMPAASRAAEFTQSEWPSAELKAAGRLPVMGSSILLAWPAGWKRRERPASPHQPGAGHVRIDAGANGPERRVGGFEVVQIALPQLHASADGMHVRVVERGHHEPPAKIDETRAGARESSDVGAGPDGDDAALPDRQRLGLVALGIQRVDGPPAQDEFRGRTGRRRVRAANRENQYGEQSWAHAW